MKAISTAPIRSVTVSHCTYNQPLAPEQAYNCFVEQSVADEGSAIKAKMIIVDSSINPGEGFEFFKNLKDDRVTYLHMPVRPGREAHLSHSEQKELHARIREFPAAYAWMKGHEHHDVYQATIPTDTMLRSAYKEQKDIPETLEKYDPKTHKKITGSILGDWKAAVDEVFNREPQELRELIHDRPHLGSIRNFVRMLTAKQFAETPEANNGASVVVNFDDDKYLRGYVERQVAALAHADFTARTQYPTLLFTEDMAKQGASPVWAMTDLSRGGKGLKIGWEGEFEAVDQVPVQRVMGFTQAGRVPPFSEFKKHPQVGDILGGEDRIFEDRLVEKGYRINIQSGYSDDIVRLAFGRSSSDNFTHGPASVDYQTRAQTAEHLVAIFPPLKPYIHLVRQPQRSNSPVQNESALPTLEYAAV